VAEVVSVVSDGIVSILNAKYFDDNFIVSLIGDKQELEGKNIELIFKETEIILSKNMIVSTAKNSFLGVVKSISNGIILSKIDLEYHNNIITAIIFKDSLRDIDIKISDIVYWLIKPTEIFIIENVNE
jgi:molybdopterin-binding protein